MEGSDQKIIDKGSWWLADQPLNKLAGDVTYDSHSGIELELIGSLFPTEDLPQFGQPLTVWGTTVRGKNMSLVRAHLTSFRTHMPGLPTSRIEAYEGVIGGFYRGLDEVSVHTVTASFDYLTSWAAQSGVTEQYDSTTKGSQILVQPPPSISLGQANGIEISVVPLISQRRSRDGMVIRERCDVRLTSSSIRPYTDFQRIIGSFRTFLTLAVGEPATPRQIFGQTDEKTFEIEGKPVWGEVEIIRQTKRAPVKKDLYAEQMLFTLRDLGSESGVTLERFLDVEQRLKAVFDLFLLNYFYPDMPPPQQFLNFINAIEVLHRVTVGGQYQSDEEYESGLGQRLRSTISENLPADFKQSLDTKLRYLHRFTLRRRLRDILEKFQIVIQPYVGDVSRFVEAVTVTRNSLLYHPNEPALDYVEFWKQAQLLGLILEAALLSEIGFRTEAVRSIIGRGKRAQLVGARIV